MFALCLHNALYSVHKSKDMFAFGNAHWDCALFFIVSLFSQIRPSIPSNILSSENGLNLIYYKTPLIQKCPLKVDIKSPKFMNSYLHVVLFYIRLSLNCVQINCRNRLRFVTRSFIMATCLASMATFIWCYFFKQNFLTAFRLRQPNRHIRTIGLLLTQILSLH